MSFLKSCDKLVICTPLEDIRSVCSSQVPEPTSQIVKRDQNFLFKFSPHPSSIITCGMTGILHSTYIFCTQS
ncbi:hypothetical protein C0J52_27854 [Blattella germanica]|nr:hypothetical protein C0J52_27854 [Blattella germanica]